MLVFPGSSTTNIARLPPSNVVIPVSFRAVVETTGCSGGGSGGGGSGLSPNGLRATIEKYGFLGVGEASAGKLVWAAASLGAGSTPSPDCGATGDGAEGTAAQTRLPHAAKPTIPLIHRFMPGK